jgi:hypothetical protein
MADNTPAAQPTISVKKSDGTLVKMTLNEFHAYKATLNDKHIDPNASTGTVLKPNEVATPHVDPSPNLPMIEETMALSSETPVIVGEMLEDLGSHSSTSGTTNSLTEEIVNAIFFLVGEGLVDRLRSLVLSRVKGVRTDAEIQELAAKSPEAGGLGLDESKVSILMNAIKHSMQSAPVSAPLPSAKQMMSPLEAAAKVEPPRPSITPSPIPVVKKPDAQKVISSLIAEDAAEAKVKATLHQFGTPQKFPTVQKMETGKVLMHDVVVPQRTMGPIDEMLACSLVDFRRLGANPKASADALMNKFQLLKNDSYLLFLQGRAAWYKSPLYEMYLHVLQESLGKQKTLSVILAENKEGLTMSDIEEISRVSKSLSF